MRGQPGQPAGLPGLAGGSLLPKAEQLVDFHPHPKHRGLKRFFETGDTRGLKASHVPKIRRILARLHSATTPRDLDAPGLRLHPLKGGRKGQWAVNVDRSWRITFTFDGQSCKDVSYEDYH